MGSIAISAQGAHQKTADGELRDYLRSPARKMVLALSSEKRAMLPKAARKKRADANGTRIRRTATKGRTGTGSGAGGAIAFSRARSPRCLSPFCRAKRREKRDRHRRIALMGYCLRSRVRRSQSPFRFASSYPSAIRADATFSLDFIPTHCPSDRRRRCGRNRHLCLLLEPLP